ncbi:MAG: transporter substrate-binding domain-containing protein [Candidatus Omnitrophica bacterium]|nr:transporter substrate-binding domain-containing protein [Candidatus Omnitrophota bacterium]
MRRQTLLRVVFGVLLGAGILLGFAGASALAQESSLTLRVGVAPNNPPLIYKEGQNIAGLEADFARKLAWALGKEVQFVELQFDELISALNDGRVDIIMSGMSVSEPRSLNIAFTEPYLRTGQTALIRREDSSRYLNPDEALSTEAKVGVERGTTGDLLVQERFRNAQRMVYKDPQRAVRALKKRKIGLFVHDAPVIWWLAAENEADGLIAMSRGLTEEYLAWGVRQSDTELLEDINYRVALWRQDGTLGDILRRWVPCAE